METTTLPPTLRMHLTHPVTDEFRAYEPTVAYIFGDQPPELDAVAAMGFDAVAFDSRAPWYCPDLLRQASRNGLRAFAFPMGLSSPIQG